MNSITRILIPFDFGPVAQIALKYALNFCTNNDRIDIMLCYVSDPDNHELKQEQMNAYLANLSVRGYVTVSGKVIQGEFVATSLKEQLDFKADIMIMGTKGANDVSGKAISNTSIITLEAHCPVLVIPVDYEDFKIEQITLAIGNDKIDDPTVLNILLVIARKYNAKIHVFAVYDEVDEDYYFERENEDVLKYYLDKYYSHNSTMRSSNIADSIMEYNKSQGVDMLAIIPRNHSTKSEASDGKLTKYLTQKTDIPFLTMNI